MEDYLLAAVATARRYYLYICIELVHKILNIFVKCYGVIANCGL